MDIHGLQKLTLLDFPGRVACTVFLQGCDLRCPFCHNGGLVLGGMEPVTDDAGLLDFLKKRRGLLDGVAITGGEPLLTPETPELCRRLLALGFEVLIETNGSLPIAPLPAEVRKILDCKLPGSGMSGRNLYDNYALLQPHDEVKFVVSSREDFDFALDVIRRYDLPGKTANLLFSPVWGRVGFADLARWIVDAGAPGRMQLQLHKLIWGDKPGV